MTNQAITQVANGNHLSEKEMTAVMEMFLGGMAAPAQIGAFITALRMKGETVEEITGAAKAMQAKTRKIELCLRPVTQGTLRSTNLSAKLGRVTRTT